MLMSLSLADAYKYQIIGRTVHLDFVQEHLREKRNINFNDIQEQPNSITVEIMADTVYVKVRCL